MSQHQQQQQYTALVSKADPIVVPLDDIDPNGVDDEYNNNNSGSDKVIQEASSSPSSISDQLIQLYEAYAILYPNIELQREYKETNQLLYAINAATNHITANPNNTKTDDDVQKRSSQRKKWWNFFTSNSDDDTKRDSHSNRTTRTMQNNASNDTDDIIDDDRLLYTDIEQQSTNIREKKLMVDMLLGTNYILDHTCIPNEVHAMARYYLVQSSKTQYHHHHHHRRISNNVTRGEYNRNSILHHRSIKVLPKIVRTSWERAMSNSGSMMSIIGLGGIIEFRNTAVAAAAAGGNDTASHQQQQEQYTSDRQQLLDTYYYHHRIKQQQQLDGRSKNKEINVWNPSQHVHAVMVGPNLLMVHWGLHDNDNTIVFYRRIAAMSSVQDKNDTTKVDLSLSYIVSWEVVAISTITTQVQESLMDVFADDNTETGGTSGIGNVLLKITDVHPLVVEIPNHAPVVTIAIARLGGYIELIPLPPQMWYGPEIPFQYKKHIIPYQQQYVLRNRGTKRKKQSKIILNAIIDYKVPDLAKNPNTSSSIIVLNATEYHSDILGLESFRVYDHDATSNNSNTNNTGGTSVREWDRELYPECPPSDYVLAIYGTKTIHTNGQEHDQYPPNISFWSFSTNLNPSAPGGVGFSIYSSIMEVMDIGKLGPDISLFVSPTIYRHWRKVRNVELRDNISEIKNISIDATKASSTSSSSPEVQIKDRPQQRITTLSISVPIVGLSFVVHEGNMNDMSNNQSNSLTVSAAVLDWNGGVTILDCTLLARAAAQTLSDDEYDQLFRNEQSDTVQPLVKVIANRTKIMKQLTNNIIPRQPIPIGVRDIRCFHITSSSAVASTSDLVVAALSYDVLFLILIGKDATDISNVPSITLNSTAISCPTLGYGQILKSTKENFIVNLLFASANSKERLNYRDCLALNYCAVQSLRPIEIVKSLIQSKKYKEAIITAEKLSTPEQAVIQSALEDCKKKIWEFEYSYSFLESIRDDEYIVIMALEPPQNDKRRSFLNNDIGLYRSVCRLALDRIKTARLGVSLALGNKGVDIQSRLIKLGTYELFCRHHSVQPSLEHFFDNFLTLSMIDLLMSCARRADLALLSMLWFRHQPELLKVHFSMLSEIPLSVSPILYQHLLPVLHDEQVTDKFNVYGQFIASVNSSEYCNRRDIPEYISHHFQLMIVIDDQDESLVWEYNFKCTDLSDLSCKQYLYPVLAGWYLHRANSIQNFVSNLDTISTFAQLGLRALRIQKSCDKSISMPLEVQGLYQLIRFSDLLRKIPPDAKVIDRLGNMKFESMDVSDIVALTFQWNCNAIDYATRYNSYLIPLIQAKVPDYQTMEMYAFVDEAIQKFCLEILKDHSDSSAYLENFTICSNIVHSSRTSIAQLSRVIKSKEVVGKLVYIIVEDGVRTCCLMQLGTTDQQKIIDGFWKMYESLPLPISSSEVISDELLILTENIRKSLTFLDILAGWPDTEAFWMTQDFLLKQTSKDSVDFLSIGTNTIILVCRSFCKQIQNIHTIAGYEQKTKLLLLALLNDVQEFNEKCFGSGLRISHLLTQHLARPLLTQQHIALLGEYLSQSNLDVVDKETISNEVMLSFNDAVYGLSDSRNRDSKIETAIKCQDVLEKWLPELREFFHSLRRFLDAAQYIGTVLLPESNDILRPEQIQSMRGIDVVEFVLKRNPKVIVQSCLEWDDPATARQANKKIRSNGNLSTINKSDDVGDTMQETVPLPPGRALFHLAQLLGLVDLHSIVAVKSLVVHYALESKLDGAAAAVCRTLINDCSTSHVDIVYVLHAVSKLVSREEYIDNETKIELCIAVNNRLSTGLAPHHVASFEAVLRSWDRLQLRGKSCILHPERTSVSFEHFFSDIMNEYNVDIKDLFVTLYDQLNQCQVDDTLLIALIRYTSFWCIGRTTRNLPVNSCEAYDTQVIMAVLGALFLHVQDKHLYQECIQEIKLIFIRQHEEATHMLTSAVGLNYSHTEPVIVTSLIGRGYTENGARRSAAAVNNVGFKEALQWAVTHSLDPGFDDPLIYLQPSTHETKLDKVSAEILRNLLDNIEGMYDASNSFIQPVDGSDKYSRNVNDASNVINWTIKSGTSVDSATVERSMHTAEVTSREQIASNNSDNLAYSVASNHAMNATNTPKEKETTINKSSFNTTDSRPAKVNTLKIPMHPKISSPSISSKGSTNLSTVIGTTLGALSFVGKVNDETIPKTCASQQVSGIAIATSTKHESPHDQAILCQDEEESLLSTHQEQQPRQLLSNSAQPSSNASIGVSQSTSNTTSPDRSTLYQVGQEAFQSSRQKQQSMSATSQGFGTSTSEKIIPNSVSSLVSGRERSDLSITIPSSNVSSPDRSTLYQAGQEAFIRAQQQRRPSSNPSREDRMRLIEEGRRLLNQARAIDPNGFFSKASTTTAATAVTNGMDFQRTVPTPATLHSNGVTTKTHVTSSNIPIVIQTLQSKQQPQGELVNEPSNIENGDNMNDEWDFDDEDFDV